MNSNEMIAAARKLASDNKAANAIFHVWAIRQRARATVTLASLAQTMKEEGFTYSKEELTDVLKALAFIGLGEIHKDHKGQIMGLRSIKVTLQSFGSTACESPVKVNKTALEPFSKRNKFAKVVNPKKLFEERRKALPVAPTSTDEAPALGTVTVEYKGRRVTLSIPQDMPADDAAKIIGRLLDRRHQ